MKNRFSEYDIAKMQYQLDQLAEQFCGDEAKESLFEDIKEALAICAEKASNTRAVKAAATTIIGFFIGAGILYPLFSLLF